MIRRGRINISEEKRDYIENHWGPIEALGNDDAQEIAQEIIADEVIFARFDDDETIYYEYEVFDEEDDYEDEPYPAFTDEYLHFIGMSMSDFI